MDEAAFVFLVAREKHRVVRAAAEQVRREDHGAVGLGHFGGGLVVGELAKEGDAVAQGAEVGRRKLREHLEIEQKSEGTRGMTGEWGQGQKEGREDSREEKRS